MLRGALGAVILDGQTESLTYIKHRDRQNNISKSLLLACNTFSINKFAKKNFLTVLEFLFEILYLWALLLSMAVLLAALIILFLSCLLIESSLKCWTKFVSLLVICIWTVEVKNHIVFFNLIQIHKKKSCLLTIFWLKRGPFL